ncbi:MAG: methyltransferase domain-containing protein [Candidatus Erginobacter occultus]|nr:methyltransferase domain-containing protein [Candidatus Erginobacter occultus]
MKKLINILKKVPGLNATGRRLYRTFVYLRNLLLYRVIYRRRKLSIPIDSILVGQQSGYPLKEWVEKTGEYERVSLPVRDSPYTAFLRDIAADEARLTDEVFLRNHSYFRMASIALRHAEHFMGARTENEIFRIMRDFFDFYRSAEGGNQDPKLLSRRGHSSPETPIILDKIKYSNNYEVVDGHHRIAAAAIRGQNRIRAVIARERTSFLQDLVLSGRQTHGDRELYQPLPQPEVRDWPAVRRCRDRLKMMEEFFRQERIEPKGLTLLDCSCSYGWFLQQFKRCDLTVIGIDRDPVPVRIGQIAYGLSPEEIIEQDLVDFLKQESGSYDIVLFLSLLHHFAIGQEKGDPAAILNRLDEITEKALFLDTGQNHEQWWREKLPEWDDEFIIGMLRRHTSFGKIVKLGEDRDNTGTYRDQYRRSLFACLR